MEGHGSNSVWCACFTTPAAITSFADNKQHVVLSRTACMDVTPDDASSRGGVVQAGPQGEIVATLIGERVVVEGDSRSDATTKFVVDKSFVEMRGGEPGAALFDAYAMSLWPGSTALEIHVHQDAGPVFVVPAASRLGAVVGCFDPQDCVAYDAKDYRYVGSHNLIVKGIRNDNDDLSFPILRGREEVGANYRLFMVPVGAFLTLADVQLDRGGILNHGWLVLIRDSFEWSITWSIFNYGRLTASDTTFRYTTVINSNNGISNFSRCMFANNTQVSLHNDGGTVRVVQSTFEHNYGVSVSNLLFTVQFFFLAPEIVVSQQKNLISFVPFVPFVPFVSCSFAA